MLFYFLLCCAVHGKTLTFICMVYFRTLLSPTLYTEHDGSYRGLDGAMHAGRSGRAQAVPGAGAETGPDARRRAYRHGYFSDLSLWDTFRTTLPWQLLTRRDLAGGVLASLSAMTAHGGVGTNATVGVFPRWPLGAVETGCMVGLHGGAFVLEALLKTDLARDPDLGVDVVGMQRALLRQATRAGAVVLGRTEVEFYLANGWVPAEADPIQEHDGKPASLTLSYAFDDFVLAGLSVIVGDGESAAAAMLRSRNYRTQWSAARQITCPRGAAGDLQCPKDAENSFGIFTEGNANQWSLFVGQDPVGLAALYPTAGAFQASLESFVELSLPPLEAKGEGPPNPYFWAGNEIDLMAPYLFSAGVPGVDCTCTQAWVRRLLPLHYSTATDGLPGNDDYGALSAWLLFSALGVYPQAGTTRYFLGSPSVAEGSVRLWGGEDGAALVVRALNNTQDNVYVSKLLVNGVEHSSTFVEHSALWNGGRGSLLEFFMSSEPVSELCKQ